MGLSDASIAVRLRESGTYEVHVHFDHVSGASIQTTQRTYRIVPERQQGFANVGLADLLVILADRILK